MKYRGYVYGEDGEILGFTSMYDDKEGVARALIELQKECEEEIYIYGYKDTYTIRGEIRKIQWED